MQTDPLTDLEGIYVHGSFDRAIRRVGTPSRAALDTIQILLVIARDLRDLRERALGGPPGVGGDGHPSGATFSHSEGDAT